MDIRQALLTKLKGVNQEELKIIINDGISSHQETVLPGLGVLFEQYYSSLTNKDDFLNHLCTLLK